MLTVTTTKELWNEETEEFSEVVTSVLEFEHSLISLSKWESKWMVPFLTNEEKTNEQTLDYILAMCLTPGTTVEQILALSATDYEKINDHIESKACATVFAELPNRRGPNERITAELIYYWMTAFRIPWEAQHWHLNRLFTLIRVCNSKQGGGEKIGKAELAERQRSMNAKRRAQYGTRG